MDEAVRAAAPAEEVGVVMHLPHGAGRVTAERNDTAMKPSWICQVLTAVLLAGAPALRAQIIVNGGFEAPDVPAGSAFLAVTPAGWTSVGPSNAHLFDDPPPSTGNWPDAHAGDQYAALLGALDPRNGSGLVQAFTVTAAGDYVLSWRDNAAIGVGGAPYGVSILGSPFSVSMGVPLGAEAWSPRSQTVTLAPGSYTLAFRPSSLGVTLLDDVSLVLVPEPGASTALAAFCCGVLGLWRAARRDTVSKGASR